jgi:hypothetical protein
MLSHLLEACAAGIGKPAMSHMQPSSGALQGYSCGDLAISELFLLPSMTH